MEKRERERNEFDRLFPWNGDEIFTQNVIRRIYISRINDSNSRESCPVSIICLFRGGVNRDFAGAGNTSFIPPTLGTLGIAAV